MTFPAPPRERMPYDSRTILNRIKTVPQVSLNCNDYNIKRQSDNTAAQRSDGGAQFALPRERKTRSNVRTFPLRRFSTRRDLAFCDDFK